jgi:hypothetical protein
MIELKWSLDLRQRTLLERGLERLGKMMIQFIITAGPMAATYSSVRVQACNVIVYDPNTRRAAVACTACQSLREAG